MGGTLAKFVDDILYASVAKVSKLVRGFHFLPNGVAFRHLPKSFSKLQKHRTLKLPPCLYISTWSAGHNPRMKGTHAVKRKNVVGSGRYTLGDARHSLFRCSNVRDTRLSILILEPLVSDQDIYQFVFSNSNASRTERLIAF
ncbi:MAG: hypothetical protein ABSG52_00295 [Terriglobales bacterium]